VALKAAARSKTQSKTGVDEVVVDFTAGLPRHPCPKWSESGKI